MKAKEETIWDGEEEGDQQEGERWETLSDRRHQEFSLPDSEDSVVSMLYLNCSLQRCRHGFLPIIPSTMSIVRLWHLEAL